MHLVRDRQRVIDFARATGYAGSISMVIRVLPRNLAMLLLLCVSPAAFAQSPASSTAEADRLFAEAASLAEAGRYAEACPKLERSLALDPAIGTEYNLADCEEHVGHLASAWLHYRNVQRDARRAGKSERESAAKARVDALAPRVGWVKVIPGRYAPTAFRFEIDGRVVTLPGRDGSARDQEVPLDPGPHRLRATGGLDAVWQRSIEARAGAIEQVRPFDTKPQRPTPQRNLALLSGGVGVVGLLVGGGAAIVSLIAHNDASSKCPEPERGCSSAAPSTRARAQEGVDAWQRATTAGNVASVGFVVAGVALATAVVLLVTAPRDKRPPTAAWQVHADGLHF